MLHEVGRNGITQFSYVNQLTPKPHQDAVAVLDEVEMKAMQFLIFIIFI
jgi:hypothetical protein